MAQSRWLRRVLYAVGVLVVLVVIVVAVLGVGIYDALHPEATADDLRERPRRTLVTRTDGPELPERTGCGLAVQTKVAGGEPLSDVEVSLRMADARDGHWTMDGISDPTGVVIFEDVACGSIEVSALHDVLVSSGRTVRVLPDDRPDVLIAFVPAVEVSGTVRDAGGRSIADASVRFDRDDTTAVTTDASGRYRIRVPLVGTERFLMTLDVKKFGYTTRAASRWLTHEDIIEEEGDSGLSPSHGRGPMQHPQVVVAPGDVIEDVDFTLSAVREVRVWCAGMPDDICNEMLVQCTSLLVPFADPCTFDTRTGELICDCDGIEGPAAIRGGGHSTIVQPDEDEAWLDFRDAGVLVGRVLGGGVPVKRCEVAVLRLPTGLEDLPRGIVAGHEARCDVEGRFEVRGLVDGDWELLVEAPTEGMGTLKRVFDPVRVSGRQTTDMGDVEMMAGGSIEGVVSDGLTGEPQTKAPVLAIKEGEGGARSTPFFAETDGDGTFRFEGLPAGEWELCYFLTPHVRTMVTVEDGAITDGVEVETSDATALETNGFSIGVEGGSLTVQDVEPGSLAEAAGLMPGDAVTGVLVAGFDVGARLGENADTFMQLVLGHWDGPGVSMLVERDGQEIEVDLDW